MPFTDQHLSPKTRQRRILVAVLAVSVLLLSLLVASQQAFNLKFLQPENPQQTLVLVALSALIFLLLVALGFVLFRNLLKLYYERRGGVLGSRFRTKMVFGALLLSSVPVLFFFLFAYLLMNRSIERWFSHPVEELRDDTGAVSDLLSRYAQENAHAEAISITQAPETQSAFELGNFTGVMTVFKRNDVALQGGFALALVDDEAVASYHAPVAWGTLRTEIAKSTRSDTHLMSLLRIGNRQYVLGQAPTGKDGRILVAMPLPLEVTATMDKVADSQEHYRKLSSAGKQVRRLYTLYLLLLTVMVLFVAVWLSLFLSKFVTRPVAALAEATQEISAGHFGYRVAVTAADELGELITSFNRMAGELEISRRKVEASTAALGAANVALDERRRHMETILESIPTGVISVDSGYRVTRSNRSFLHFLGAESLDEIVGRTLRDLFGDQIEAELEHLLRKADRMGTTATQLDFVKNGSSLDVAVTASALRPGSQRLGYVMVFEDFSDLLKAQKQAAWQEVARRVAHEIKNPLTPIALSADRIRRHLERGTPPDEASLAVMHSCAETITTAVESVRKLVDQFSALARFPASHPTPQNINSIVEKAVGMFVGRLESVKITTNLDQDLPLVMADPEAIKRALANLIDNAMEAMTNSLVREASISTSLVDQKDSLEIVVADSGHGVTRELKEKLFLPYFSTKERGTGLGLPIVGRIVQEHHGSIRVEENVPAGTRFIIELPIVEPINGWGISEPSHLLNRQQ